MAFSCGGACWRQSKELQAAYDDAMSSLNLVKEEHEDQHQQLKTLRLQLADSEDRLAEAQHRLAQRETMAKVRKENQNKTMLSDPIFLAYFVPKRFRATYFRDVTVIVLWHYQINSMVTNVEWEHLLIANQG
eukprot:scaffold142108_cov17-Prasinocladus_malaysianus.AAC.1